jgi:type I restriction enzyme S subunit
VIINAKTGWSKVALGDLLEPLKRKNRKGEKRVLTVSGEHGLVDQGEYFDRDIASKNLDNYWLLKNGEFAYNRSSMKGYPYGAIKRLYRYDKGCVSPIYLCFYLKDKDADAKFFSYIFESGLLNQQLMSIAHAGARAHGMLNVSQDEFFQMVVPKPPMKEQKKIAGILSSWDQAIEELGKLINSKARLKKGLIQKLIT